MKKHFLTGLATLLPVVLTALVVQFFITLFTAPFLGLTESLPFPLNHLFILLALCGFVLLVGFLGQWIFLEPLLDHLIHRIPLVRKIYKSIREMMHTLFGKERPTFSKTALVPYFHGEALALIAHDNIPIREQEWSSVYVLGPLNPLGLVLFFPNEKITPLDLSVEEASKVIISCGVIRNRF